MTNQSLWDGPFVSSKQVKIFSDYIVASSKPCAEWKTRKNVAFHSENVVIPIVLYVDEL